MKVDANDVLLHQGVEELRRRSDEEWCRSKQKDRANADEPGTASNSAAADNADPTGPITIESFRAYMPGHQYIFLPTGELWVRASVNGRLPRVRVGDKGVLPSVWLDKNCPVEQITWAPGMPRLIKGKLVSNGGWIDQPGGTCFNLYRPAKITIGDPAKAGPWLELVRRLFGDDADHLIKWFAHRVQKPGEKINHALVLGGAQGIGKDTILEPVKFAVGPWNFLEVSPTQLLGRFNGFAKSVILRVSEARDLGEFDRYAFYDHLKTYSAAPPDTFRIDEKNLREYSVMNVCGVIITTNHKLDGVYLPRDDRRHFVAWANCTKDDFDPAYWKRLWDWFANGGTGHVAAYLRTFDITDFDPKAPPPKTAAFLDIVSANAAPEDAEMADALDRLGNPSAVTIGLLRSVAPFEFADFLRDRRNARKIPHRFEEAGYVAVRNPDAKDGQWKIGDKRQAIYAKKELSNRDRLAAAVNLTKGGRP